MTHLEATAAELAMLGSVSPALEADALGLAAKMDVETSGAIYAQLVSRHLDVLTQLRKLAPGDDREDKVDELSKRRERRMAET